MEGCMACGQPVVPGSSLCRQCVEERLKKKEEPAKTKCMCYWHDFCFDEYTEVRGMYHEERD
jgi:hypothetical protein